MSTVPVGRVNVTALCLLIVIFIAGVFSLGHGQVQIPIGEIWMSLTGDSADPTVGQIVNAIRLPRVITAILGGAAMGIAGVLMQTLFRNPMADAWSLGLLSGGQLGVALLVTATAFAGPQAVDFLTLFRGVGLTAGAVLGVVAFAAVMASLARRVGNITLLVVGLMLGFTVQGLVSVIMHFANRVGGRVFSGWNDGTFSNTTLQDIPMLAIPVLLGAGAALVASKGLSSLLMGETYARSMGVDVARLRRVTLAAVVLLVAPVTAYCGPITFIGLIVPHFARYMAGTARILPLIPLAALSGALLALAADAIVNAPWEQHFLHLNTVLAMLGAPVVIFLLVFSPSMRGRG